MQSQQLMKNNKIAGQHTAGQLLRTDNTIRHAQIKRNHKLKGKKVWKIRISAEYSKKRHAHANFLFQVFSSTHCADKSFKDLLHVGICCSYKQNFTGKI